MSNDSKKVPELSKVGEFTSGANVGINALIDAEDLKHLVVSAREGCRAPSAKRIAFRGSHAMAA